MPSPVPPHKDLGSHYKALLVYFEETLNPSPVSLVVFVSTQPPENFQFLKDRKSTGMDKSKPVMAAFISIVYISIVHSPGPHTRWAVALSQALFPLLSCSSTGSPLSAWPC